MYNIPDETISVIRQLLVLEEASTPDWQAIGDMCDAEVSRINESGLGGVVNGLPYQFLEDYDIRRKDDAYGSQQRSKMRNLLGDSGSN